MSDTLPASSVRSGHHLARISTLADIVAGTAVTQQLLTGLTSASASGQEMFLFFFQGARPTPSDRGAGRGPLTERSKTHRLVSSRFSAKTCLPAGHPADSLLAKKQHPRGFSIKVVDLDKAAHLVSALRYLILCCLDHHTPEQGRTLKDARRRRKVSPCCTNGASRSAY